MWKSVLLFLTIIAMCYGQGLNNSNIVYYHKRRPYYDDYYHGLLYGGGLLYYVTFIAIKIKIALVIATILTVFIVAGKVIALIKFADTMKSSHDKQDHVVIPHSPIVQDYSPHHPTFYNREVPEKPYFQHGMNDGPYYDSPPPNAYGRSSNDSVDNYYNLFLQMIRKFNATDAAFKEMNLESPDCKKKIVCITEYSLQKSKLLLNILQLFRDDSYDKYKPTSKIRSRADCEQLYEHCNLPI